MELKQKYLVSLIFAFLSSSLLNLFAQSANFMKSIPISGPAPSSVIPVVTKNGPMPLEVIGNPFSQPNIQDYLGRKHLDWYGSGDVNNDEKIDSLDVTAIDTAKTDRADIDGDGVPGTQNDKQILLNYLSGKIPHLPGQWNELTTRDERVSWLEKMIKIDTTNNIFSTNSNWICADRTTQEQINFTGISNANEFIQKYKTYGGDNYSLKGLDKFNIPVYTVGTINGNKLGHSIMAAFIGDNPLNFNDWYFWSAYTDRQILPGDFEMKDGPVSISLEAYVRDPDFGSNYFGFIGDIVKFNLSNGIPTLERYEPHLTLNNPNIIKVHVGNLEKIVVDSGKFPDGTALTPGVLEGKGYKAIPDTTEENTALPINLSYFDSDTTKLAPSGLGGSHYQFLRKFFSWIYSGGVTKKDSTTQIIEVDKLTSVQEDEGIIPKEFVLYQNYPNPFNPSTTIKFSIPSVGAEHVQPLHVLLKVYDLLGREVATLVNEEKPPGNYEVTFSAEGGGATNLPSGVYFYTLRAGDFLETKKMLLMK